MHTSMNAHARLLSTVQYYYVASRLRSSGPRRTIALVTISNCSNVSWASATCNTDLSIAQFVETMMNPKNTLTSALIVLLTSCAAPVEGYFISANQILESWQATVGAAIGPGNGAFKSLDGTTLAVITQTCTVTAYDPATGTVKWTYAPADSSLVCKGGLWFASSYIYFAPDGATRSVAVCCLRVPKGRNM